MSCAPPPPILSHCASQSQSYSMVPGVRHFTQLSPVNSVIIISTSFCWGLSCNGSVFLPEGGTGQKPTEIYCKHLSTFFQNVCSTTPPTPLQVTSYPPPPHVLHVTSYLHPDFQSSCTASVGHTVYNLLVFKKDLVFI